jgi:hypothetical protein
VRSQRILRRIQTLQSVVLHPATAFAIAVVFIAWLATYVAGPWPTMLLLWATGARIFLHENKIEWVVYESSGEAI